MSKLLLARHEETLEWYVVGETHPRAFACIKLTGDQINNILPIRNFAPTHRHYKGGLYQVYGETILPGTQTVYVVYGDRTGLNWLREKEKFEALHDGAKLRFTPVIRPDV
jgi:hypothetical protein